jgi:hypothetical protein
MKEPSQAAYLRLRKQTSSAETKHGPATILPIAFGLLCFIGCKMIYEVTQLESCTRRGNSLSIYVLLLPSVATSIDALAVGLSFAFLGIAIATPIVVIGAVKFSLSFIGAPTDNKLGHLFENRIEIPGGLMLIGIGLEDTDRTLALGTGAAFCDSFPAHRRLSAIDILIELSLFLNATSQTFSFAENVLPHLLLGSRDEARLGPSYGNLVSIVPPFVYSHSAQGGQPNHLLA